MYLSWNASKARLREAEHARKNRMEIVQAFSHGQVSRGDLIKWGLFTTTGFPVPKNGLSPFARSTYGQIPTGAAPSPATFGLAFTQPLPRFEVLPRKPISALSSAPTVAANTTLHPVPAVLGGGYSPGEGRP